MQDPTRASVAERYSGAIGASHLHVVADRSGDVDLLVAAGWLTDGVGSALYRLMSEFDCVRGAHRMAHRVYREAVHIATKIEAEYRAAPDADGAAQRLVIAKTIRTNAESAATSSQIMVLSALKSMQSTREAVHGFALAMAPRQGVHEDDATVRGIAGQALMHWLDPMCHPCDGRGFTGGFGTPMVFCETCKGTGRTRPDFHQKLRLHEFGRWLQCEMDRKTENVERTMQRYLRNYLVTHNRQQPGQPSPEVVDLQRRLEKLRSSMAQED